MQPEVTFGFVHHTRCHILPPLVPSVFDHAVLATIFVRHLDDLADAPHFKRVQVRGRISSARRP